MGQHSEYQRQIVPGQRRSSNMVICVSMLLAAASTASSQYAVDWYTIDGGGGHSMGGNFIVGGTIGQTDALVGTGGMSGGVFKLQGGFWTVAAAEVCACPGDMNGDGFRDGLDVQEFLNCLRFFGGDCSCADVDHAGGVTVDDLTVFVEELLLSEGCE